MHSVMSSTDRKSAVAGPLKRALQTACLSAAALLVAQAPARAEQVTDFSSNVVFGDSYADIRFQGLAPNCPVLYPQCRFSNGTNFTDTLNTIYDLQSTNLAVGGAQTGTINVNNFAAGGGNLPGFTQQVSSFLATGRTLGARDLVTISVGGNDQLFFNASSTTAQIAAAATGSVGNAVANIQRLVGAGARNIVWNPSGNTAYMPIDRLFAPGVSAAQYTTWSKTFFQQAQAQLAPLANSGVRIFLFDYGTLQERIAANPGQYGFTSAGKCFYIFDPASTAGACLAQSSTAKNGYFYWDGIHLTSAGFALMARYMANQIDAPLTVAPHGEIVLGTASAFTGSLLDQIEASRPAGAAVVRTASTAPVGGMVPASFGRKWSLYGAVTYDEAHGAESAMTSGYRAHATGGHIGLEYQARPELRLGVRFGYSQPKIALAVQNAHLGVEAYQLGGYVSYTKSRWFADFIAAYGRQQLATDRQGVIDTIRGKTDGDSYSFAGRLGYLFDLGPLRIGPVAGVTIATAHIDGYTETGDSLLTNMVAERSADIATASTGLQLRAPIATDHAFIAPFATVTWEKDLNRSGRFVTTTQTSTPLLPVLTPVELKSWSYGKVSAGASVLLSDAVGLTLNGSTTFGRDGDDAFGLTGGVRLAF